MVDLIVFRVGSNNYALNIENIQRIIQGKELTNIPNAHKVIDGMMSYENDVIKVLNFRKLIGLPTYNNELEKLFAKLRVAHKDWVDELTNSIHNGTRFSKTTNPHKCELGMWLDNFKSVDDSITVVLNDLVHNHKQLHQLGAEALEVYDVDQDKAKTIVDKQISEKFNNTMKAIDTFIAELDKVSNSLQKMIIYEKGDKHFAIKVDSIEDIAHIDDSEIMSSDDEHNMGEFLELQGILDIDGVLINIIKTVDIPK